MRTLSLRSLIRLIKSIPLPFLREISTTARSGWVSATRRKASAMSAASPQTSRSECRPIRAASASRTAGWSSTIRIRVRLVVFLVAIIPPRDGTKDPSAGGLDRFDGQHGPYDGGTVTHDAQPETVRDCRCQVHIRHADAVVFDTQLEQVVRFQADANVPGPGVLERIVDGFLGDEVEVGRGEVV